MLTPALGCLEEKMKKNVIVFFILFVSTFLYAESPLKIGDKYTSVEKNSIILRSGQINALAESNIELLTPNDNLEFEDIILVKINKKNVGILEFVDGKEQYIFDFDNDGILDLEVPFPMVPIWIMTDSNEVKKDDNNNVEKYFNEIIELFNGTENPFGSGTISKVVDSIKWDIGDPRVTNRDVLYGIWLYYGIAQEFSPELDFKILDEIEKVYKNRFGLKDTPNLILLHKIETLINQNNSAEAKKLIKIGEKQFPDCIPIKVYSWQLEDNKKTKEKKYKELKQNYPNHWIVKQI